MAAIARLFALENRMAGAVTAGALVISMSADVATLKTNMSEGMRAVETSSKKMADDISGIRKGFENALVPLQQLTVKVGSLESNMAKAQSAALSLTKGLILGAAAGMSIDAIKSKIFGVIDSMAMLKTMSEKTGTSVENLSKLSFAAKASGSDLDAVAGALAKMSKGMAGADNETKGAGLALSFLGIKAKDAAGNLKDPAVMFTEVAKKLGEYKDGAGKAALAMALFGKAGADMLPTLKLLGEQGDIAAKATDAQATAARQYQRDLAKLDAQKGALFKTLAVALLPTMSDFTAVMLDASKNTNLTNGAVKGLATDNSIESWADSGAMGLARLLDMIIFIPKALASAQAAIAVAAANQDLARAANPITAIKTLANGGNPNDAIRKAIEVQSTAAKDAMKKLDEMWNYDGAATEKAMAAKIAARVENRKLSTAAESAAARAEAAKPILNYSTAGEDGGDGSAEKKAASVDKEATAYATLSAAIREKIIASGVELTGAKPLNEAQKLQVVLDQQLATGKLKLSPLHIAAYEQDIKQLGINLALLNSHKSVAAASQLLTDERNNAYQSALAEAQANEGLVAVFGLSKSAIEAQTLARAEERLAQRGALELDDAEVAQLERVIEARKRNVAAMASLEGLEAEKKFNLERIADQKKTVEKYDDVFRIGFADMVNGGKGTWKSFTTSLATTFKTSVADQIYKTFAQPFVVKFVASMLGITGAGVAGAAQAAGSASGSVGGTVSMLSNAKGAYSAASMGYAGLIDGAGTGIAALGSTFGSSAVSAFGAGFASNTAAGVMTASETFAGAGMAAEAGAASLGASVAAAVPYVAAALAIAAVFKLGFGHGDRQTTAQGVTGSFSGSEFSGNNFANWKEKGGWFSSDRTGTVNTALDAATQKSMTDGFATLKSASAGFAASLGMSAAGITGYSKQITLDLTSDTAKNQAVISDLFVGMGEDMARSVLAGSESVMHGGETYAAALQRLAVSMSAVNGMLDTLNLGLYDVSVAGAASASVLVDLFGGLDKMKAISAGYFANYYSSQEKVDIAARQLSKSFSDLGYAMPATKDGLRAMIEAQKALGPAGQQSFVALMNLSGAYSDLTSATAAAAAAEATASAATARSNLKTAYDAESSALQGAIDKTKAFAASLKTYRDGLSLGGLSTLTPMQKYAEAQAQYAVTLAKAQAGSVTAQNALTGAASSFLDASRTVNASDAQYSSDFARVQQQTGEMAALAATQIDVGQASLDALTSQVSGLITLNDSTLSVFAAVNALTVAMGGKPALDGSHSGGLASVPFNGYRAELHEGEGVIDAPAMAVMRRYFGAAPSSGGNNSALITEMRALREEVKLLRAEQKEQTGAVIANTHAAHDNSANKVVAGTVAATKAAAYAAKQTIKLS